MVELIAGGKGKGKTKYLLNFAAESIQTAHGSIVYLDKNTKHMYELSNKIRLIDISSYHLKNSDEFMGFILGLLSQDHDLEKVFLDSFLTISCLDGTPGDEPVREALNRLSQIGDEYGVTFVISISLDEKDIPSGTNAKIAVSL